LRDPLTWLIVGLALTLFMLAFAIGVAAGA
jgi:hypothetical protein